METQGKKHDTDIYLPYEVCKHKLLKSFKYNKKMFCEDKTFEITENIKKCNLNFTLT